MFYYLYEVKNSENNKFYVGVHKTTNIDDGYMGSGTVIKNAIQKHGVDKFVKTIIEFFDSEEQMFAREKEIVTDDFLLRDDVYNLRRGGNGGFGEYHQERARMQQKRAAEQRRKEYLKNPTFCKGCGAILDYRKRKNLFCSHSCSANINNATRPSPSEEQKRKISQTLTGRQLTDEHKLNISISMKRLNK